MNLFIIASLIIVSLIFLNLDKLKKILAARLQEQFSDLYTLGFRILLVYMLLQRLIVWGHKIPALVAKPSDPSILFNLYPPFFIWLSKPSVLPFFEIIFGIFLIFFAMEIKPKVVTPILFILIVIGESYSKFPHSIYIVGLMVFAYVIYYLLFWDKNNPITKKYIFPISFFLIGTFYFGSFLSKAANLPAWLSGESLQAGIIDNRLNFTLVDNHLIPIKTIENLTKLNIWEVLVLKYQPFAVLLSNGTLLAESLILLLFLLPPLGRALIAVFLISFHVGVDVTLGLPFYQNIVVLAYLSCDWFNLFKHLGGGRLKWQRKP